MITLPPDFLADLSRSFTLNVNRLADTYDPELTKETLLPIKRHKVESTLIHTSHLEELFDAESPEITGCYEVEYINLMTMNGLLVWYPQLDCFGCFDEEHGYYFALKGINWETLKADTFTYLAGSFEWDEGWDYVLNPVEEGFEFTPDKEEASLENPNPYFSFIYEVIYRGLCLLKNQEGEGIVVSTDEEYNIGHIIENKERREVNGLRVVELTDSGTIKYKTDFNNIRKVTFASTDREKAKKETKKYAEYAMISMGLFKEQTYNYILWVLRQNDYGFDRYFMSSLHINSPHKEILRNIDFSGVMRFKELSRIYTIHNQKAKYTVYTDEKNQIHHVLDEEGLPISFHYQVLALYEDDNDRYEIHETIFSEDAPVVIARRTKNQYGYRPFSKDLRFTVLKSLDKEAPGFILPTFPNLHDMGVKIQETDPEKAIAYLQRALTFSNQDYNHYHIYIDLGVAYKTRSSKIEQSAADLHQAYNMYEMADRLQEDKKEHHFAYYANKAVACLYLDKEKEALALVNEGIERSKEPDYLKPIRALAHIKSGNYEKGIRYIENHTDFEYPDNETVMDTFYLAYAYHKLNRPGQRDKYLHFVHKHMHILTDKDDLVLHHKMMKEIGDIPEAIAKGEEWWKDNTHYIRQPILLIDKIDLTIDNIPKIWGIRDYEEKRWDGKTYTIKKEEETTLVLNNDGTGVWISFYLFRGKAPGKSGKKINLFNKYWTVKDASMEAFDLYGKIVSLQEGKWTLKITINYTLNGHFDEKVKSLDTLLDIWGVSRELL